MKRLFRLLLHLHPQAFKERFGAEILEQATRDHRRARRRGLAAGWISGLATAADLLRSALLEHASPAWRDVADDESTDGTRMTTMMDTWIRTFRHAARGLRRSPGFTATTVATLALALGANAAIFSVVDAVLLAPLPYEHPDRLVYIAASAPGSDFPDEFGVSAEFFIQYRDEASQLESLATFNSFTATARAGDNVARLRMSVPSVSLFETLGVTPALGRLPEAGESEQVVLLSHALWTTWFGGDPSVVGRTAEFMGASREIIGVMGSDFRFPRDEGEVMAWIPVERTAEGMTTGQFGIPMVGRMAPGADPESLARELSTLASRLPELYGGSPEYARLIERHVPVVRPLKEWVTGPVSAYLWVLMGSVGVVLLIACANVANLFTVRAQGRRRELAVRRAMGAGRRELVRVQLSEAILVAAGAGGLAVLLAVALLPTLLAAAPDGVPRLEEAGISGAVLAFTAAATALTALLCGLIPALRSSAPDLNRLRDGARGSTGRTTWGRNALVATQTALTLVLLVGSGLLLRSFQNLADRDPGYDTEDILTFQFAPEQAHLTDGPSWARFHMDFMERLRALPGVERVGILNSVPLDEGVNQAGFVSDADPDAEPEGGPRAGINLAGGDAFRAMGIEVLRGRAFADEDHRTPGNVVVSEAVAEMLWPGENPLGRRLRNSLIAEWHTVVGVVEDVVQEDLRGEPLPMVYYPMIGPTPESWALGSPGYVVRSSRAASMAPEIRELVREVAPEAPVYRVYTMEALVRRSTIQLAFTMFTLALAAGLALLLATIGLYGVLSHVVAYRTREIGVRMALGARRARVERMVVGQGGRIVGLGIGLGLVVALAGTRVLEGVLYGVAPVDVWTFGATSVVLLAVGLVASYLPARRASRIDPVQSMRMG